MSESRKQDRIAASRITSICFWLALWAVLAFAVGNDVLFAGPAETLLSIGVLFSEPGFWHAVLQTSCRIVFSAFISGAIGIVMGILSAHWRVLEILLAPPLQIMKSAPVACVVVILLVAFGSSGAIIAIVAFVALPPFYVCSLEAAHASDNEHVRVLELMGVSGLQYFLAYTWPHILPLYQTAAKTSVALAWRAGITGELLSIPLGSIGASIYVSKLTLDTPALLGWTVIVMLLAFICEFIVVKLLACTQRSPHLAVWLKKRSLAKSESPIESPVGKTAPGQYGHDDQSTVIEIENISKSFDGRCVIDNATLALERGERVCLMAPTGSGKSTLLGLILGLVYPETGSVSHAPSYGIVTQRSLLIWSLSSLDNVFLCVAPSYDIATIEDELSRLLPEGTIASNADELSGGTKRLVEIARALYSNGAVIVLDEPFAGLDDAAKQRACAFILSHLDDRPLIVATHDAEDALLLDACTYALEQGSIVRKQ